MTKSKNIGYILLRQIFFTVRAYKGDKKLEDHPQISVIGVKGSVLEDLRTRLR